MGEFLRKYGESIYATRGGPFIAPDEKKRPRNTRGFVLAEGNWWGGSTHKENAIYLHILRWPGETIMLPSIPRRVTRHRVLTGGDALVKQGGAGIEVSVPAAQRHAIDTIVKLELDGPASSIATIHPV
jgi:alpha-L-fucosidase